MNILPEEIELEEYEFAIGPEEGKNREIKVYQGDEDITGYIVGLIMTKCLK